MLTETAMNNLPEYYQEVYRLREECNDVISDVIELSQTKRLKNYIENKEDVMEFVELLWNHALENMYESKFYSLK